MRLLKIVPDNTNIQFVRIRHIAFAITALLTIAAVGLVFARGLNFGVDFVGGVAIEEKFVTVPPRDQVRSAVDELGVGEAALQRGQQRLKPVNLCGERDGGRFNSRGRQRSDCRGVKPGK